MKITIRIENGFIMPYSEADQQSINNFANGVYSVDIKNMDFRTIKQNAAMHKYFTMLANELNDAGLTIVKVLKVDVGWTADSVKEQLWKPIQKALTKKKSTTKLTKAEVSWIYDTLNATLGSKYGVSVQLPHKDME